MEAITLAYPAKIEKRDDDGEYYLVTFRDIENCFTQGESLDEALKNAQDVLGFMLQDYVDDETPLPKVSKKKDSEILIEPLPEVSAPLLIYLARTRKNISQIEIARRLGISKQRYHDIEHGKNLTMRTLNKAIKAIGFQTNISLIPYSTGDNSVQMKGKLPAR